MTKLSRICTAALLLFCAGCVAMVHESYLSSRPLYGDLERLWPPLTQDKGRVVVFYPRDTAQDIINGMAGADIALDAKRDTILDGCFIWAHYPPGPHKISRRNVFGTKPPVEFNVAGGQTTFIQVSCGDNPILVDREAAMIALAKLRHAYKDARMWGANQK